MGEEECHQICWGKEECQHKICGRWERAIPWKLQWSIHWYHISCSEKHPEGRRRSRRWPQIWALRKAGVPNLKVIVGEVGWATEGHRHANVGSAMRFYNGLLKKLAKQVGTPPRTGKIEVYVFGLIDEDMKSILPGNFERHWGIFRYDSKPKFPMDLTSRGHVKGLVPVKGVKYLSEQWCVFNDDARDLGSMSESMKYACSLGDCTVLGYGASCNHLDSDGNVSYAFNMHYQMQDQDARACDFGGLAKITAMNASRRGCLFPVQIVSAAGRRIAAVGFTAVMLMAGFFL